ncbi:Heat shock protein 70 B2 [Amphibalanus amphitrite]|uniref:Heat shock protein 70 B2 n=1 Tax=Amphibalanus amphitrite TaxID=1232801 RepID=A0A6A4VTS7_AMPAM|nr:Heat shock protein 70 B2 [Amphibalanus amphitrite]
MAAPSIGIDLGTTYSCVAVLEHDKVEIIANDQGHRTTPSWVAFTDTERLVGQVAKQQAVRNPHNTVFDAKRLIGRQFTDPAVQQELKLWPFTVVDSSKGPLISVEYKGERRQFTPEEISAMVLAKMKSTAEAYLGQTVTDVVVTVPAYFSHHQRAATIDAGRIAGLKVRGIINEPTAAALAYGVNKRRGNMSRVLVFDLGGGTFDVSVLKIADGNAFHVLATSGDTHLGGQDFDNRMVQHFVDEFKRKHKIDISKSTKAMQKLRVACEQAKHTLSSATQAEIEIDSLYQGMYFNSKISRARFEQMCMDLFRRTLDSVEKALHDAHLDKSRIDDVVLVGGSTRIPKVQKMLQNFFDGKKLNMNINPDEAVAYGAAIQAAVLEDDPSSSVRDVLLRDVIPLSVGVETFSLGRDNQDGATVRVLEGERVLTSDNCIIGEFTLNGLAARRRDHPGIRVTFDFDADGILHVSASDVQSGRSMEIAITERSGRLSSADIDRMVREAEQFRAEDDALRERIDVKNQLEAFVVKARYAMEDAVAPISEDDRRLMFDTYSETMDWLDKNSLAEKEELVYRLQDLRQRLSPALERITRTPPRPGTNQQQAAGPDPGAGPQRVRRTGRPDDSDSADELLSVGGAGSLDGGGSGRRRHRGSLSHAARRKPGAAEGAPRRRDH